VTVIRYALTLVLLSAISISLRPRGAEAAYYAPSMEYGAAVFPMGHPDSTDRDFDALVAAGMNWAKIPVQWRSVEGACKGCFDWADLDRVVAAAGARGIRLIARLDHQPDWARIAPAENGPPDNPDDYTDFVAQLVWRYSSGGIPVIEIWNEPNLSREWGGAVIDRNQAAQYVYMLKLAYQAAKAIDPNITVLSAGLSPTGTADGTAQPDDAYLQWMYEEDLALYSDGIGLHGNSYGLPPATPLMADAARPHPSFYFRRVEQLHDIMVANGDGGKQVWLLEFGYTSDPVNPAYAWHAVDEFTKAEYLVQGLEYAKSSWYPWIAQITVWAFADPEWDPSREQYWWAITEPDGTPRPAYLVIAEGRASGRLP
jgi:polysaccharide biosynthesis protein PslG